MARLLVLAILVVCLVYVCQARPQDAGEQPTDLQRLSKFFQSMVDGATQKFNGISQDIAENPTVQKAIESTREFASKTSESIKKETEKLMNKYT